MVIKVEYIIIKSHLDSHFIKGYIVAFAIRDILTKVTISNSKWSVGK